jgi:uncharacterized protein
MATVGRFEKVGQYIHDHRLLALALLAAMTLFSGFWAMQSKIDNSLDVWQSDNDPHWLQYQQFIEKYNIEDPLFIYLPGAQSDRIMLLADKMRNISGVDLIYEINVKPLTGGKANLISIIPLHGSSPSDLSTLLQDVRKTLYQYPDTTYHLGGVWFLTDQLDTLSARSTQTLFPIVIFILFAGVVIILKKARNIGLIMTCGLLPGLQLTGIMALAGVRLNMILLALPPLTMILGMSHAIHLLTKKQQDHSYQAMDIFAKVAPPCLLSGLTTMIGFLSLTLSSYQPVQQLGIWGAVGALLSLVTSLLLLPPFFIPAVNPGKKANTARWVQILEKWKWAVLLILFLIVMLAVVGATHLQRGSYILDFFKENSIVRSDYLAIEGDGVGLTPFEVELAGKNISPDDLQEKLKNFSKSHPQITHYFYSFASGITVPDATEHGAAMPISLGLDFILEDVERLTILTRTLASEKTFELVEQTEKFFQNEFGAQKEPYVTGSVPLYTRGQKQLFTTLITSFSIAFLSISFIMGLVLRSARLGLLAIIPNFLPVLLILGLMGWAVIPLSVATVTVASIVFGIVVDDTIHFLHSWKEKTKIYTDTSKRLQAVFSHVGPAMITTTLVAGTGFLGFIASPFLPLRNFGLLISMSLWLAICCDLLLLPALLLVGKKR